MMDTMAAVTTILHCGDHPLSHKVQMSSKDWKCRLRLRTEANQHHNLIAKLHSKKRWKVVSVCMEQREHIDGIEHPLSISFSSVGTLSCINLQTNKDFEGGMSLHQIFEAQFNVAVWGFLNWYASFRDSVPEVECFQISKSSLSSRGRVIFLTWTFKAGNLIVILWGIFQWELVIKSLTDCG